MGKVVILDTNVLLADPNSMLSFPRTEIVIPETVLGELDKLKTARVDQDLRFRGREVSRTLFELSEDGSLVDGVELPDGGGRLRVAPFDSDQPLPQGVSLRNADDRILATAYHIWSTSPDDEVTLVTNDLNMLLKAQTLGVPVERYGDGVEGGWARRHILRPVQRYRVPITILAVALAVFVAVIGIALYTQQRTNVAGALPSEFKALLTPGSCRHSTRSRRCRTNRRTLRRCSRWRTTTSTTPSRPESPATSRRSSSSDRRGSGTSCAISLSPLRTTMRARTSRRCCSTTGRPTERSKRWARFSRPTPNHVNGNFNLGIFLAQGRRDFPAAAKQFEKVIDLTENDPNQHSAYQAAVALLEQTKKAREGTDGAVESTGAAQ